MFKSKINIIKKKLSSVKDLYSHNLLINTTKEKVALAQTYFLFKKEKVLILLII